MLTSKPFFAGHVIDSLAWSGALRKRSAASDPETETNRYSLPASYSPILEADYEPELCSTPLRCETPAFNLQRSESSTSIGGGPFPVSRTPSYALLVDHYKTSNVAPSAPLSSSPYPISRTPSCVTVVDYRPQSAGAAPYPLSRNSSFVTVLDYKLSMDDAPPSSYRSPDYKIVRRSASINNSRILFRRKREPTYKAQSPRIRFQDMILPHERHLEPPSSRLARVVTDCNMPPPGTQEKTRFERTLPPGPRKDPWDKFSQPGFGGNGLNLRKEYAFVV